MLTGLIGILADLSDFSAVSQIRATFMRKYPQLICWVKFAADEIEISFLFFQKTGLTFYAKLLHNLHEISSVFWEK